MNYREPLTKNEIRAHAAHYEQTNPAVYCGTYAKYNRGSLYGMWIDLSTFETYREFIEFCNRLHADEQDAELMFQDYEHFPSQWLQCCIDYSAVWRNLDTGGDYTEVDGHIFRN